MEKSSGRKTVELCLCLGVIAMITPSSIFSKTKPEPPFNFSGRRVAFIARGVRIPEKIAERSSGEVAPLNRSRSTRSG